MLNMHLAATIHRGKQVEVVGGRLARGREGDNTIGALVLHCLHKDIFCPYMKVFFPAPPQELVQI